MNFLTSWRDRLAGAISHHPTVYPDSVFGELEEIGGGLWHSTTPLEFLPGMEPVAVTIDADCHGEAAAGMECGHIFLDLQHHYPELREKIGELLCKATPKAHAQGLWDRVTLGNIEIWRDPHTRTPVVALEYFLNESPDYVYTIRLERQEGAAGATQWRPVDVLVTG